MNVQKEKTRFGTITGQVFVWSITAILAAAIAVGDVDSAQSEENYSAEAQTEVVPSTGEPIQSLSFKKDMTIKDALRFLSAKYQKNIVPSTGVDGLVTISSLYDVSFEEAMDAILGLRFKYRQQGNFINVYTVDEYEKIKKDKDRMIFKSFELYYITASEVQKLIGPVLSSDAKVQGSTASTKGVSTGKQGVGSDTGGDSMALHDTLVVYDFPENIAKVEHLINSIDIRPQQVLIEATILSATLTEDMEFGVDWNLLGGVSLDGNPATQDYVSGGTVDRGTEATKPITQIAAGTVGTAMESFGFAKLATGGLRIGITSGNLAAFLTALERVTDITIMANPKILALNKQAGTVLIGQQIGYRDRTTIDSSGQATVGEVSFLETGTKLSFRPFIGSNGYIRMEIYPQDSTGQLNADGIPTKTTTELTTNIMVKNGETIIIGGLFRDAVTTTRSQIPLLGDLPLVGGAFRGTTDQSVRQEVIIILTPRIIDDPTHLADSQEIKDVKLLNDGAHKSLNILNRTKIYDDRLAIATQYYKDGYSEAALAEIENILEWRPDSLEAARLREKILAEKANGK